MGVKRSGGLSGKLKKLTADMERQLGAAVQVVAEDVQQDARISITTGSVSGKAHQPSAPGAPPNNDSGHLANSIVVERLGPVRAQIVATAEYAAIQELGGTINHPGGTPYFIKDGELVFVSKDSPAAARLPKTKPHLITLPERPYMRPAARKNKEPGIRKMRAAVDLVLSGAKLRGS